MNSISIDIGEEYIQTAFQINDFLKGVLGKETIVVDCYFGPDQFESPQSIEPDTLLGNIRVLRQRIRKEVQKEPRRTFLTKQLDALSLLVRFGLEEQVTFKERVRIGLDVDLLTIKSERIEELMEQAKRDLRKKVLKGNLTSMATRWRKRSMTTGSEIVPLAQEVASSARQSTQRLLFELPEKEQVEFRAVPEAPWSAYHHYQGNYQGLIEINIKLPRSKYGLWHWVTHETYPGHQTQLVSRELGYQQKTFDLEATIAIINTPDSTLAEGLAEAGTTILSSDRPLKEPEQINHSLSRLRRVVGINSVVMLNQQKRSESEVIEYLKEFGGYEEEYANANLPFMTHPMWAPYGFTYYIGGWLVRGFFEAAQEAHLLDQFIQALYHELHTPSTLQARIRELDLKISPLDG